jgi:hypothetical protein
MAESVDGNTSAASNVPVSGTDPIIAIQLGKAETVLPLAEQLDASELLA